MRVKLFYKETGKGINAQNVTWFRKFGTRKIAFTYRFR